MNEKSILNQKDISDILESLMFTKRSKEDSTIYPDHDFKIKSIEETQALIEKVRLLRDN